MAVNLGNKWDELLQEEFQKPYYLKLREFLKKEYQTKTIYPNMYDLFNALRFTDYDDVKVVILGQDPYHGHGQAHGLSFSVKPEIIPPPSLLNIFKELENDLGFPTPNNGYLKSWAEEGVLLLNTVMTVRQGAANSHKGMGWEFFTDKIITLLNERSEATVFILWGANARSKESLITNSKHFIIKGPHPSPLSAHRGFFGSKPFSKANAFLSSVGRNPVNWQINNL